MNGELTIQELTRLKDKLEDVQRQNDRMEGALETLYEENKVRTVQEARKSLTKLHEEAKKLEKQESILQKELQEFLNQHEELGD